MNRTVTGYVSAAGFLLSIVAANAATNHYGLVALPFGLAVTAGTFFAGAALVLRDGVHESFGRRWSVVLILVGGLLTAVVAPALAIASSLAFLFSELVDRSMGRIEPRASR